MNNRKSLMTHIVLGYPSFDINKKVIKAMSDAGVEYIELQIPFSDPIADGPIILKANQKSLENGTTLSQCFNFAMEMTSIHKNIKFIFMTYYNIIHHFGVEKFLKKSADMNIFGTIIPDIPPEEDDKIYYREAEKNGINPIGVISPTTSIERLNNLKKITSGLIYCTSTIGITGQNKKIKSELKTYVKKVQAIMDIPVAVGFGIDSPEKAKQVSQFADIIVMGSKIIKIVEENSVNPEEAVCKFLKSIKESI